MVVVVVSGIGVVGEKVDVSIEAVTTVNEFAHEGVDFAVVDVVTEAVVELVFELENKGSLEG